MKYDGAQTDRDNPATRRLAELAGIDPRDVVFLAGSTQEPEESIALDVFRRLSPDWPQLRLIIVPRHPERFESVARMLDASGVPWQRRTKLESSRHAPRAVRQNAAATEDNFAPETQGGPHAERACYFPRVLLVDVVGELAPGGGRPELLSSAAAWAIAADRT